MKNNEKAHRSGPVRFKRAFETNEDSGSPLNKIIDLDKQLLKLLLKRFNLLSSLRSGGRLDPKTEKYIREAWQKEAGKVSRDPDLAGHFFALLQQLVFFPKSSFDVGEEKNSNLKGFILAPSEKPVNIDLEVPLSNWDTFAWLYIGAASGKELHLEPCLQNDPQIDFIKSLVQMGGAVSRKENAIITREGPPLGTPDRVVNVGSSEFGFYLILAHYLGRSARVKFTGASNLKIADFSIVRHLLPQLQARFITLVPKTEGLPARLEASGFLPSGICLPADTPELFAEAIIFCAPFYQTPFAIDIGKLSTKESILAKVLPILKESGLVYTLNANTIAFEPTMPVLPKRPKLPLEPELASFLLGFVIPLTGKVHLVGQWPNWPETNNIWQIGTTIGWQSGNNEIKALSLSPLSKIYIEEDITLPNWGKAFLCSLASCVALKGGKAKLPAAWLNISELQDYLRIVHLNMDESGDLIKSEFTKNDSWIAPSPAWVLAMALAACARDRRAGWRLGNPAEIMDLWPTFWQFYNTLPEPKIKKIEEVKSEPTITRRRIKTNVSAKMPDSKEE